MALYKSVYYYYYYYYAARRSTALSDTMIRPFVCPSPRRAAALGYRLAGCLQLSHVWTADRSADGRRSAASRTAIDGGDIVSPRPGAIPFTLHYVSTVYYAPITTLTAYYRLNIQQRTTHSHHYHNNSTVIIITIITAGPCNNFTVAVTRV